MGQNDSVLSMGLEVVEETEKSGDEIVDGVKQEFQQDQQPAMEQNEAANMDKLRAAAQQANEHEAAERAAEMERSREAEHEMER